MKPKILYCSIVYTVASETSDSLILERYAGEKYKVTVPKNSPLLCEFVADPE